MGKHKHSKDKMHITYTEMKEDWGGKKLKKQQIPFSRLPYYCCGLSLLPFQDPVCTKSGNVFDIYYIMPFIKKYGRCPVTGETLKATDLIKMNWSKNEKGEYQDPISYKVFTEYTHIVCIETSGNVYAYDTIQELNKKPKFYFDLISGEEFQPKNIITIQNPNDLKSKQVLQFDYMKNNLPFVAPEKIKPQIKQNETISRIMEVMHEKKQEKKEQKDRELEQKKKAKEQLESREDVKGFIDWCIENKIYQHQRETDYSSASLTSTSFTPSRKVGTSYRDLKENQIRQKIYQIIKKDKSKGLVQMATNIGNFNIVIHCDLVPKTSENFIELTEAGYYNDCEFHRLVKDFCLQGGDPSGTGNGGQSVFGKPFQDQFHDKLKHVSGSISMANSGENTNRSQFFICLSNQPGLDQKHSVFGEIISNNELLTEMNNRYSSKSNKPKHSIKITKMYCYDNPYRKAIKKLKSEYEGKLQQSEDKKKFKDRERWIEGQKDVFSLDEIKKKRKMEENPSKPTSEKSSLISDQVLGGGFF